MKQFAVVSPTGEGYIIEADGLNVAPSGVVFLFNKPSNIRQTNGVPAEPATLVATIPNGYLCYESSVIVSVKVINK